VCSGQKVPKPDGSFQTIFSNSVLEHIPEILPVLKEARRLLGDDGRIYVTVPTDQFERASALARLLQAIGLSDVADRYCTFYNRFWGHFHAYDEIRWRELFNEASLEVVQETLYEPRNMATTNDLLAVLALPSLLAKKIVGRWILFPSVRRATARLIYAVISPIVQRLQHDDGGCLVFYELKKRPGQN
jgi:SAM-dependent methyltransferase